MSIVYRATCDGNTLAHWRTKGSKNGVRLWQHEDGSYTTAGRNSKPGGRYNQAENHEDGSSVSKSSESKSNDATLKLYKDNTKIYDSKMDKYTKKSTVAYPDKMVSTEWCNWYELCRKEKTQADPLLKAMDDEFEKNEKFRPDKSKDAATRNLYYSYLVNNGVTASPDGWDPMSYMGTNHFTKEYQNYLDEYFDQDNLYDWQDVLAASGLDNVKLPYASYVTYLGIKSPNKQFKTG